MTESTTPSGPAVTRELPVGKVLGPSFGGIFRETFLMSALTFKTAFAIMMVSLVMVVIFAFFGISVLGLLGNSEEPSLLGAGIAVLIGGALLMMWFIYSFVSLQVAAQREVIFGEAFPKTYFGSFPNLSKGTYCLYYLVLFLPIWLIPILTGFGILTVPLIILLLLLMPLLVRYKLSMALIAAGRAGSWGQSWRMTAGNTLRMWVVDVVVLLLAFGVGILTSVLSFVLLVFVVPLAAYMTAMLVGFEGYVLGHWLKLLEDDAESRESASSAPQAPAPV